MSTRSVYVIVLAGAACLLGFVKWSGQMTAGHASEPVIVDAAYRDGLYQAQLDVRQKRHAHITVGRWSSMEDRASYIAGYQQGFLQQGAKSGSSTDAAQVAGYSDGMADGARDRKSSFHFQPGKGNRLRQAAAGAGTEVDAYRQGYANGYQQGYYGQESGAVELIGEASRQF